uniref:Uncharacterized protein n=1 Tax=Coccolithus braarudii TaxID=221442 RepID=A0A7S0Q0L9_9EUKA|mmetsp:Transcript_34548/g.73739  ORF Transcript_34548/g.73739 Transcript_34548/m.73739 type:complete len:150 (+) Transcript_34548:73-522(+)
MARSGASLACWVAGITLFLSVCTGNSDAAATPVKGTRKFCNVTGLAGDYRYEACGDFCKAEKAVNHCRYCKCKTCAFCQARLADTATSVHQARRKKKGGKRRRVKNSQPSAESVTVTVKHEPPSSAKVRKNRKRRAARAAETKTADVAA